MNCEMARNQMLEADLSELGGEGDGALAQHLRACAQCRERARRILEQTAALKGALERLAPRVSPEGIQRGQPTPTTQLRRWAVTVPLALAALTATGFAADEPPAPSCVCIHGTIQGVVK